jgi:hypothetical protein
VTSCSCLADAVEVLAVSRDLETGFLVTSGSVAAASDGSSMVSRSLLRDDTLVVVFFFSTVVVVVVVTGGLAVIGGLLDLDDALSCFVSSVSSTSVPLESFFGFARLVVLTFDDDGATDAFDVGISVSLFLFSSDGFYIRV